MLSAGSEIAPAPQQTWSRSPGQQTLTRLQEKGRSLARNWPLWLCLALALAVRLFLAIRHNPVIEGDEALTGIQAENILRGEWPIYYYGQAYMGSLEAYILALFFAVAGPSVLVLRIAMSCTSLLLVWLTWRCGEALACEAGLRAGPRRLFLIVATAIAALPPLYDAVLELRSYGGYTEAMIVMLWLLWATLRLTQRWHQGASRRELAWRWAGIGLLVGLGLWIDPLIAYALATMALWLAGFLWQEWPRQHKQSGEGGQSKSSQWTRLKAGFFAAPAALPSLLLGLGPALIYGAQHSWENFLYMLHGGHPIAAPGSRLHILREVVTFYARCIAPRVIGGTLPTEPYVTQNHPAILTPGLVINGLAMMLAAGALLLSWIWPRPILLCLRRLTVLPLLFALCLTLIYCLDPLAVASVYSGCGPWDLTGRYVVPLVIVLPFFLAAAVTLCWYGSAATDGETSAVWSAPSPAGQGTTWPRPKPSKQPVVWRSLLRPTLLVLLLLCYFSTQFSAYAMANTHNTFETSGCVQAPGDYTPIITYLRQQHISYALATAWVGNPITFVTNQQILVTEPRARVPAYSQKVLHAAHYALLLLVHQDQSTPAIVQALQHKHWRYTLKRFPTMPGWELMVVITPDHNISPADPAFRPALTQIYNRCDA
ncbi:hypothetical protein [Thermogemmatispora tikiterensis]|nr:hypothetical protein [Thermogemmatispora tikiterensis]